MLRDLKKEGNCDAVGNPCQFQAALASRFSTSALLSWLMSSGGGWFLFKIEIQRQRPGVETLHACGNTAKLLHI